MPWPFGGGKKQKVLVRRYHALSERGARKDYEKDANKLAKDGYRPTNTVDHAAGRSGWGGEIIVTYELVEPPTK